MSAVKAADATAVPTDTPTQARRPGPCDDAPAAGAVPRCLVGWWGMSGGRAADATAFPTDTPPRAPPTAQGPCANAMATSEAVPTATPTSAHGRRLPKAP